LLLPPLLPELPAAPPDEEFLIVIFRPGLSDLDRSLDEEVSPVLEVGGETLIPRLPGVDPELGVGVISRTVNINVNIRKGQTQFCSFSINVTSPLEFDIQIPMFQ
jgi:hypothetical protein